ncbi:MAG: hypothetical protein MI748_10365 [Opitutales bacterium]|nr:hypothetical protein [Opitutales bacterium]
MNKMKVCFIKFAYSHRFCDKSFRFTDVGSFLDQHRPDLDWVMTYEADFYVVEDTGRCPDSYTRMLLNEKEIVQKRISEVNAIALTEVPFDEYDIVVTVDPILDLRIMNKHPRILWCSLKTTDSFLDDPDWETSSVRHYDLFLFENLNEVTAAYTDKNLCNIRDHSKVFEYAALKKVDELTRRPFPRKCIPKRPKGSSRLREQIQSLTIVFVVRDADYGGGLLKRVVDAYQRNANLAQKYLVDVEWIVVEWNPIKGAELYPTLQSLGCKCIVVGQDVHESLVNPTVAEKMGIMQYIGKNAGIRHSKADWLIMTNADIMFSEEIWKKISESYFDSTLLYRAERCDVSAYEPGLSDEELCQRIELRNDIQGGLNYSNGSGDFLLMKRSATFPFDETIDFSEICNDARYCENWSFTHSGETGDHNCFEALGDVYKVNHAMTFMATHTQSSFTHKGYNEWNWLIKEGSSDQLYEYGEDWGLIYCEKVSVNDDLIFYELPQNRH